jgi:hypothetical protein
MHSNFIWSRSTAVVLISVLGNVAIAGSAQAATDTIFKYSTPKTGYLSIGNAAMAPSQSTSAYVNYFYSSGLSATGCFATPVHLPQGAVITAVAAFYKNGAASTQNSNFYVFRETLNNGSGVNVATIAATDRSGTTQSILLPVNAANATINNLTYAYVAATCLGQATNTFYGMRIRYTYTNAGD